MKTINLGNGDFKALIIGDLHATGHNPKSRKDVYADALANKLNECINLSDRIDADALLFLGDIFHSPEISFTTVARYGRILMNSSRYKYSIVGNHDIHGGNIKTYLRCGIGLLEWFNILNVIPENESIFFIKGNNKIQLTGQSYHYDIDQRDPVEDYCRIKEEGATHLVHLVHGYLTDKTLPFKHTLISDIKDKTEADITLSGHIHNPFYLETDDGKIFANPGALGRITAAKAEMRMPQVYILTIKESGEYYLSPYQLQSALEPEEVLDRSKLEDEDVEFYKMNNFITSIQNVVTTQVLNPLEIVRQIAEEQCIEEAVRLDTLEEISNAEAELEMLEKELF